jgi:hypothetical protein
MERESKARTIRGLLDRQRQLFEAALFASHGVVAYNRFPRVINMLDTATVQALGEALEAGM